MHARNESESIAVQATYAALIAAGHDDRTFRVTEDGGCLVISADGHDPRVITLDSPIDVATQISLVSASMAEA